MNKQVNVGDIVYAKTFLEGTNYLKVERIFKYLDEDILRYECSIVNGSKSFSTVSVKEDEILTIYKEEE